MRPHSFSKDCEYYFCTDTIVGWQYVFTSFPFFDIIIDALAYCREKKGLRLHAYVVMPNHIHTIISTVDQPLPGIIRDFKRHTSRRITEQLHEAGNERLLRYFSTTATRANKGNDFKVWQSGSYPIMLHCQEIFLQKMKYIHDNPVKKGYVVLPEHWIYSSARNYAMNDHSIIPVDLVD